MNQWPRAAEDAPAGIPLDDWPRYYEAMRRTYYFRRWAAKNEIRLVIRGLAATPVGRLLLRIARWGSTGA